LGTHALLEAAKRFKQHLKRFIHVSTDEVYGESSIHKDAFAFDEKSTFNPSNPYAATKAAAELLVKSYS
jgi:UDP-glucose 4,6-dehydratase